ncbi:unnamed protein product, partial [Owenia fusiformis]
FVFIAMLCTIMRAVSYPLLSDVCKDSNYCQMCTDTVIKCEGSESRRGLLEDIPINDVSVNITALNLGYNMLKEILIGTPNRTTYGLFTNYPNLKCLNLVGNRIQRFKDSFIGLPSLQEVNLSENPIETDSSKASLDGIFEQFLDIRILNVSRLNARQKTMTIDPLILALDSLRNSNIEILDFSEIQKDRRSSLNISQLLQL